MEKPRVKAVQAKVEGLAKSRAEGGLAKPRAEGGLAKPRAEEGLAKVEGLATLKVGATDQLEHSNCHLRNRRLQGSK